MTQNTIEAQINPAQDTWTTLFVCDQIPEFRMTALRITNTGSTQAKVSIAGLKSGETVVGTAHYLLKELPIDAGDSYTILEPWTMSTGQHINVLADTGDVAFTLFGEEINK